MPDFSKNLNLTLPYDEEQYNIDDFNGNFKKIDDFAKEVPLATKAKGLQDGAKINGVLFNGEKDVITGLGLWDETQTYAEGKTAYKIQNEQIASYISLQDDNTGNDPETSPEYWKLSETFIPLAKEGQTGVIKPDNYTTFTDEDGTLHSPKYNLFDIIQKDHILSFEESKGLERLGSYVYSKAIAGSRYGYDDFYQECVKQFKDQSNTKEYLTLPWVQPNISANITSVEQGDIVITSSGATSGYDAWKAIDANSSDWWTHESTSNGWWQIKFPYKLLIKGLKFYQKGSTLGTKEAQFYTSEDKLTPIGAQFIAPETANAEVVIEQIPAQGIITDTIYLDITSDYNNKVGMSNLVIEAEKYITTVTKNKNSHIFYDIKDKTQIDEIYNKTGNAWYYGVDEENKRILLPRYDLINFTGKSDIPVVGNGNALPITNGEKEGAWSGSTGYYSPWYAENQWGKIGDETRDLKSMTESKLVGVSTDPDKAGLVVATDINNNLPYYLYMVVGNVPVNKKANADIVDITTSTNDTIPLGFAMYSDYIEANAGWVEADGDFLNGKSYNNFYSKAVLKLSQPFYNGFIKNHNEEYNDFDLVLNQDEMTFRLPLKITFEHEGRLFFHIANALENKSVIDCAEILEDCVFKSQLKPAQTVVETYQNTTSGYRIWSDGYCEQWGYIATAKSTSSFIVTFLKPYKDTSYTFLIQQYSAGDDYIMRIQNKTNKDITVIGQNDAEGFDFKASGYLAEGTY